MTWFGKTLTVLNTIVSLVLLGAITWMVLEWRQFRDDVQKIENQVKLQQDRWNATRNTLAGVLKEKIEGNREFVWDVRSDGKVLVPQEKITVREARNRIQELENGGRGRPSLADLAKKLEDLYRQAALRRDELDKAQHQTRFLSEQLAKVSDQARQIIPAPGAVSPVDIMYQQKLEFEAKIREEEPPLNVVRQELRTLQLREEQLRKRERELRISEQVPPFKPPPGDRTTAR